MAQLIDTSVFIALERRNLPVDILLVAVRDEPVALAAITASELLVGVHRANTPARRIRREAFVDELIETIPIIPFDLKAARVHARLAAQLLKKKGLIGSHDLIIAATAMANDMGVLTDNVRDFSRIPGLLAYKPDWDKAGVKQ